MDFESHKLFRQSRDEVGGKAITIAEANERVARLSQSATGQNPVESSPNQEIGNSHYAKLAKSQFIFYAPARQKRQSHAVDRGSLNRLDFPYMTYSIREYLVWTPSLRIAGLQTALVPGPDSRQISGSR